MVDEDNVGLWFFCNIELMATLKESIFNPKENRPLWTIRIKRHFFFDHTLIFNINCRAYLLFTKGLTTITTLSREWPNLDSLH